MQLPSAVPMDPTDPRSQEARRVDEVSSWWWGLWGATHTPEWAEVAPFLETLTSFSAFPTLPVWHGDKVGALIKAKPNKAPGADGRVARELKEWPPAMCELLARFYSAVETRGEWPLAMRRSLVAMLAKKGTGTTDDYRPITLLSVLYRL